MGGRFIDSWPYVWSDIWEKIEASDIWLQASEEFGYSLDDLYKDLYLELVKALKKAPYPAEYDAIATDPILAKKWIKEVNQASLRSEGAVIQFFENAFDVVSEAGSAELENLFKDLVAEFIRGRNLGYELKAPFSLISTMYGVFSALFGEISTAAARNSRTISALDDFNVALQAVQSSKSDGDIKTFILKSSMLAEALASIVPNSSGQTLSDLCNSIHCWPHSAIRETVKKLYGFCSDYPGIRHNASNRGQLRDLDIRDAVIVPMLLVVASGYFGSDERLQEIFKATSDPVPQKPYDLPLAIKPAETIA